MAEKWNEMVNLQSTVIVLKEQVADARNSLDRLYAKRMRHRAITIVSTVIAVAVFAIPWLLPLPVIVRAAVIVACLAGAGVSLWGKSPLDRHIEQAEDRYNTPLGKLHEAELQYAESLNF